MNKHSTDTIVTWLLQQAGWHPERRIDFTVLDAWYATHCYMLWPEACEFMTTFGMVAIDATTYSEQPLPRTVLAGDDQRHSCYFRRWNAAGFAIILDPRTISDFSRSLPVWDRNPILQERTDAIPIGTCVTPFEPLPIPLVVHRHAGLMTVHTQHTIDAVVLKRSGETLPRMMARLVRACLVYGWHPAGEP
ncbi:SUKH-3 domain-containing protein [Herpetosiphon sp. NSE202]|uniref:SUKH-3 domain-containing protein n=1 Tax=Herpetosiphon sp. NSE202 TaxID=3351349 RepID=UPI00362EB012